jgi:hypothetical protein
MCELEKHIIWDKSGGRFKKKMSKKMIKAINDPDRYEMQRLRHIEMNNKSK